MPLRLVHLEDGPNDREPVAKTLRAEGIDCAVVGVESREDFERALADAPDLILSDYSLPGFGGDEAQDLARTRAAPMCRSCSSPGQSGRREPSSG